MSGENFQHVIPALRLFSGPASLAQLGKELARAGCKRAVVFCGASVMRRGILIDSVLEAVGDRCAGVFSGVQAHSPVADVEAAAQVLLEREADAVIALGGGSAIVTARAASILLAEGKGARALSTWRDEKGQLHSPKLMAAKLPQFIVPTTPTTAVAKAGSAVFDTASQDRLALYDPKTRAHAVFIEPTMLSSAPQSLLISASLNTYAMAIEGLMSPQGDPLSDALLMHALRLLRDALSSPERLDDPAVRTQLVLAAILCGQGTDFTGGGITTVLGHAIGARCDIENGLANAILLTHVMRFNEEAARGGLAKIRQALGMEGVTDAAMIEAVGAGIERLGVPSRLSVAGVEDDAFASIADRAMGDWFLKGNPRHVDDAEQLQQILRSAF
jgi:alcohol dehydrogenase class IV